MAVAATESRPVDMGPESPPGLSSSKSSKSSSSSSSANSLCLSEAASTENLSHFEDITLTEGKRDSYDLNTQHAKSIAARPQLRPLHSAMHAKGKKRGAYTVDSMRSVHMARPPYPSLQGQVNGVLQETSMNVPRNNKRFPVRIPSASSAHYSAQSANSRSPSPDKSLMSTSPRSAVSSNGSFLAPTRFARRQSWQPGKKSVKELEAEYHDSDEEVPEDAVIWNVPISPIPNTYSSRTPSPERSSKSNLHAHASAPAAAPTSQELSPKSEPRVAVARSATTPALSLDAVEPFVLKERTKSWHNDLSDEVKFLAAALEAHNIRPSMDARSVTSSAPASPPRLAKSRSRTSFFELPPIQKGDIMIDPLPVSKEKEAVLARTRPSWLPPKCRKEEKRHLKEWEKMMARSAEAEKRRAAKELEQLEASRQTKGSVARIWEEHVLPNWDVTIQEPRTRELWWRGVPSKDRGMVWSKAIGNDLQLSESSYTAALNRAKSASHEIESKSAEEKERSKEAQWHSAITRDVPTVFSELGVFVEGSPLHDTLSDVLLAYSSYRADVGYVYGMHSVAGLLVLHMDAPSAFIALANILNRPLPLGYLVQDQSAIDRWTSLILSTLRYKFPSLHDHVTSEKAGFSTADEWLEQILTTLFTRVLDVDTVSRIWDVYVFEGDKALVRALVGVLGRLESRLYGSREEILKVLGWDADREAWSSIGSEEEVMSSVRDAGKMDRKASAQAA